MTKTNKVSMAQWNPLLVAIANKKLEIVRYFLHDLKIAIIHAGKRQGELAPLTKEYAADQEIFSLQLTCFLLPSWLITICGARYSGLPSLPYLNIILANSFSNSAPGCSW